MKYEHYAYISQRFDLGKFCSENHHSQWWPDYEGKVQCENVIARVMYPPNLDGMWQVEDTTQTVTLFWKLPGHIAKEVLTAIHETECLFV